MGIKVVILCGGFGTRLREETELKPKPMVEIGGMPILWHIMKTYAHYGFNEFILCLGYKGEVIKNYFYNYEILSNDFTIELGSKNIKMYPKHSETGWKITLVDTGLKAMTGARIKRIEDGLEHEPIYHVPGQKYFWVFGWTKEDKKVVLGPFVNASEADGKLAELADGEVFELGTRDTNRAVRVIKAELMSRGEDADEALRRVLRKKGYEREANR